MKTKLKLVLLVVFGLSILTNCSDDNNDSNSTDGELLGVWELVEFNYSGDSVYEIQGQDFSTSYTGVGTNIDTTMEITENPNDLLFSGSYDVDLTFSFAGQTQNQIYPIVDAESISNWTRLGDVLTIDGEFASVEGADLGEVQTQDYVIEELTDNTLVLTSIIDQIVDNQGLENAVTMEIYMKFTR